MNNINDNELNKFNEIAHRWWDTKGPFKPLHEINPLRMKFIEQHTVLSKQRVLDVGCGGGILSEAMALQGAKVTGIDLAEHALEIARVHQQEHKLDIRYLKTSVEDFAELEPQQYQVITCLEMLEHVPNPRSVINACYKLLAPRGHLYLSTINRSMKAYLQAIIGAEYLLRLLPRGTHDYESFIQPAELANWCRAEKFTLKEMQGISYNPLTQHYKLTDDVSVNYLLYCQKQD